MQRLGCKMNGENYQGLISCPQGEKIFSGRQKQRQIQQTLLA